MGVAAIGGFENSNGRAMDFWEAVYPNTLLVTLTDTFSTEVFYQDFVKDPERAKRWTGLRQDSGDPFVFAPRAREIYQSMNIDHTTKVIIYSDALTVDKALGLKKQCDEIGFTASFGIGTSLSNDFKSISSGRKQKNRALNMVIKLYRVDGKFCAKISDELTKVRIWLLVIQQSLKLLRTRAIRKRSERRRRFSVSMSSLTVLYYIKSIEGSRETFHAGAFMCDAGLSAPPSREDDGSSRGYVNLHPILPIIPFHGRCLIFNGSINVVKPSEPFIICRKDNTVLARFLNPNSVVRKRIGRVEIENIQQPGTLKDDDLVGFVF